MAKLDIPDLAIVNNLIKGDESYGHSDYSLCVEITSEEYVPLCALTSSPGYMTKDEELFSSSDAWYTDKEKFTKNCEKIGITNPIFVSGIDSTRLPSIANGICSPDIVFELWKEEFMSRDSTFALKFKEFRQHISYGRGVGLHTYAYYAFGPYSYLIQTFLKSRVSRYFPYYPVAIVGRLFLGMIAADKLDDHLISDSGFHDLRFKMLMVGCIRREMLSILHVKSLDDITQEQLQDSMVLLVDASAIRRLNKVKALGTYDRIIESTILAYLKAGYTVEFVENLWTELTLNPVVRRIEANGKSYDTVYKMLANKAFGELLKPE